MKRTSISKLASLLHFIVVVVGLISPILFQWWIIAIYFVFWYLHIWIFGRCIISVWQYGEDSDQTYTADTFTKLGIPNAAPFLKWWSYWITPGLVTAIAYVGQTYLGWGTLWY